MRAVRLQTAHTAPPAEYGQAQRFLRARFLVDGALPATVWRADGVVLTLLSVQPINGHLLLLLQDSGGVRYRSLVDAHVMLRIGFRHKGIE